MDAVEQRLMALETEVRKLRRRLKGAENQDQLTLDSPLIAQSVAGEVREVVKGYDGTIYDVEVDALSGLAAADDSFTLISSQVNDTTDDSTLVLKATRLSGALVYDSKITIHNSGDGSTPDTKIVLSPLVDWTLTGYELTMPASSHIALGTASSDPSSPADGWVFYRTDTDRMRLRANSAWVNLATTGDLSGYTRVYSKATAVAGPADTTSETSLGSFTVTAGDMGTTGILRVRLMGRFWGSGASTTVTLRIKFGGTTLYADASVATTTAALPWFAEVHIANVGATNEQAVGGFILIGAQSATTGEGDLGTDEVLAMAPFAKSDPGIDTTANCTFDMTAQLSDGTAGNAFRCYSMVAELL